MLEIKTVPMEFPADANIIVGPAHFFKTVEDLYEAVSTTVPQARFGLTFNESPGACLTRSVAARSKRAHVPAVRIARLYAHAGDKEQVLYWLQRACDERETPPYPISEWLGTGTLCAPTHVSRICCVRSVCLSDDPFALGKLVDRPTSPF